MNLSRLNLARMTADASRVMRVMCRSTVAMLLPVLPVVPVIAAMLLLHAGVPTTDAAKLQDLVRIKGAQKNKLVGMGLVTGLNGTGDGGKYLPAMRPLASLVRRLADDQTEPLDLKDGKNVALVAISATIQEGGAREGDHIDVQISAIGPCKSLAGGRLFLVPLTGPLPQSPVIYAMAEGAVIVENIESPTTAVVRSGAIMVADVRPEYVMDGKLTLVLDDHVATWPMANNVADIINDLMTTENGSAIAKAVDQKSITIQVAEYERDNLGGFVSQILNAYIDPALVETEARVVINERTGTIIVTGDVEIAPVIISHKNLTITTITPQPAPDQDNPELAEDRFVRMDPQRRGGANLNDLLRAFNQLQVEAPDRIAIIKEIHRSGKLLGKLVIE